MTKNDVNTGVGLCLASPIFFPTYGGSHLRYMRYLPGLRRRGLDVQVFTGTPTVEDVTPGERSADWDRFALGAMIPEETVNTAPVHRVRLPKHKGWYRRWRFNRSLLEFCRQPGHRPQVLQLVGTIRIGSIPTLRRLRRMGITTLYSVTTASKVMRKRKWLDLRLLRFRMLFNCFDCIVTNNTPLGDALRNMGVSSRVEVIPNGVDLERFHPGDRGKSDALRDSLGIGPGETMIVTVGAVIARKGSDLLVQAWNRLHRQHPDTHLVFVGPRYDATSHHREFQRRVDDLAAESGAAGRIHFVGISDKVPDFLRAADIFVLPSKREGMPNSVIESMACGTPVVMTPFVGLSDDLGRPEEQYLLAPHDAQALAQTLARLVGDRSLRETLAESALHWIKQNMALEGSIERYASLYKELAGHQPASR